MRLYTTQMENTTLSSLLTKHRHSGLQAHRQALTSGQYSVQSLIRYYLDRIERINPLVNAYVHVATEQALERARELDELLKSGVDLGPLMGLPIAIKDNIVVEGMPTGAGTLASIHDRLEAEGEYVKNLKAAGCIVLGKVHTVEFAMGSSGANYRIGAPKNPRDLSDYYAPGGSSSGSAAAVAAGLCTFAIGTDTGGSVRTPAAFCGVTGVKPSRAVWARSGVLPLSESLDCLGYITPTARDANYVWLALTDSAPVQSCWAGVRIAVPHCLLSEIHPSIEFRFQEVCDRLEQAGASISYIDLPDYDQWNALYFSICTPEFVEYLGAERCEQMLADLNVDVRARLELSLTAKNHDLVQKRAHLAALRTRASTYFEQYDVWLSPTKQHLPPRIPKRFEPTLFKHMNDLCAGPTRTANVLDLAALSLAVAMPGAVFPMGVQLQTVATEETRLISLAAELEKLMGTAELPTL